MQQEILLTFSLLRFTKRSLDCRVWWLFIFMSCLLINKRLALRSGWSFSFQFPPSVGNNLTMTSIAIWIGNKKIHPFELIGGWDFWQPFSRLEGISVTNGG